MIHLELQPEIEAELTAEAQAQSLPTEQYVEQIILSRFPEDDEGLRGAWKISPHATPAPPANSSQSSMRNMA